MAIDNGYDRQSPLPWATEKTVQKGSVKLEVTAAVGRNGKKLFSWSVSRAGTDASRTTKHLREDDIGDLEDAISDLKQWFQEARFGG